MDYEEYLFFLLLIFFGVYLMNIGFSTETRRGDSFILFVVFFFGRIIFGLFILFFAYANLLFLGPGNKVATMPADMFLAVIAGILTEWAFRKTIRRRAR